MTPDIPQETLAALERMLGRAPERITRLPGGANNLVLEIVLGHSRYLAKAYFQHKNDPRDRLGAEFGMLTFLWRHGVRDVPEPLQSDPARKIGVFEYVDGVRLAPGEVTAPDVRQLVGLLAAMWRLRGEPDAQDMAPASDACFSVKGYMENVGGRFQRIRNALEQGGAILEAEPYIRGDMTRTWERILAFMERDAQKAGLDADRPLERAEQTLNPADHGFHNTLREASGRLRFLDFEYAGWDDPAQMICNALWQPAVPLPVRQRKPFLKQVFQGLEGDAVLAARSRLVYPILGFKWACIMLNEFLPVSEERRRFAGARPEDRRREQLEKSRRRLTEIEDFLAAPSLFDGTAA